jgi:hypothetical protein
MGAYSEGLAGVGPASSGIATETQSIRVWRPFNSDAKLSRQLCAENEHERGNPVRSAIESRGAEAAQGGCQL